MVNHYQTLGVERNASDADIKSAYRRLAARHHPDRPGGSLEKMQALNIAYDVLKDPDKRADYDYQGRMGGFNSSARAPHANDFTSEVVRKAWEAAQRAQRQRGENYTRAQERQPDPIDLILKKQANDVDSADIAKLYEVSNSLNSLHIDKRKIIARARQWMQEKPALAKDFKNIAIVNIMGHLGDEFFSAIVKTSPQVFNKEDIGRIFKFVNDPNSNMSSKRQFLDVLSELAVANKNIASHMTYTAIAGVAAHAGGALFEVLIKHAPQAFDDNDSTAIFNFVSDPNVMLTIQRNLLELSAELVAVRPDLAGGMTRTAIRGIVSHGGDGLFMAIVEHAPKAFDKGDVSVMLDYINNSFTNVSCKRNLAECAAKIVGVNKELAPHMTRLAIAGVVAQVGDGIFTEIIRHAPKSFTKGDMDVMQGEINNLYRSHSVKRHLSALLEKMGEAQTVRETAGQKSFWRLGF